MAVLLIVAMVLLLVVRPVVSRSLRVGGVSAGSGTAIKLGMPHQLPKTIEEIEQEIEQQLDQTQGDGDRRQPVLTRRVAKLAEQEPEGAAKLVRSWLNDGRAARS